MNRKRQGVSRRMLLAGAAAGGLLAARPGAAAAGTGTRRPARKTFVLVHGAWHGAWCWRRVADRLTAHGHKVFTPTLAGLGEHAHLNNPNIDLATHTTDVVNVFKWEDLSDVVLVGHSYGGLVIGGAADQMADRIASIVYLDAFVPKNGQALIDFVPKEQADALKKQAADNVYTPPFPATVFNVNEKDRAWVDSKCTPQSARTWTQGAVITGKSDGIKKKTYIQALGWKPGFQAVRDMIEKTPGWIVEDVPCGHDVMIDMPERLTKMLLAAA